MITVATIPIVQQAIENRKSTIAQVLFNFLTRIGVKLGFGLGETSMSLTLMSCEEGAGEGVGVYS